MVEALLPAVMVPPVTATPALAVRFAPLPMVKTPLLDVTNPVTVPAPFQLPPVTPSVPTMLPGLVKEQCGEDADPERSEHLLRGDGGQ